MAGALPYDLARQTAAIEAERKRRRETILGKRPLTVREAARCWGCAEAKVRDAVAEKRIDVIRLGPKTIRIPWAQVIDGAPPLRRYHGLFSHPDDSGKPISLRDGPEPRAIRAPCNECVYFVQGALSKNIKIGVAAHFPSRLKGLQASSGEIITLLALIYGSYTKEERELHARFARYRIHYEWFKPAKPLLDYIRAVQLRSTDVPGREAWALAEK